MALGEQLVPFHEASVVGLQSTHSEKEEEIQVKSDEAAKQDDEAEWQLQRDFGKLEKERARGREMLAGWFALVYLVSLLHLTLNILKRILDETHPPNAADYKGKSWLDRITDEYRQRFRINLESHANFPFLRQLVLARNAVEHDGGRATEEFMKIANPLFVAKIERVVWLEKKEQDVIIFSNQLFKDSVKQLDEFMDWAIRELILVQSGRRPDGPLRAFTAIP